jgi:zinc protease
VVSGDIDYADTRRRIERYYGSLSRQSLPDEALPPEPPQMSERSQSLQRDVQAGTLAVVYRTPSVRHPDSAALEVLASILGSGPSSRLHRRIVYQQQAAASISAWTHGQRDSSLFAVTASMKPGQSVEGAFQSTAVEVARLRSTLVSDAEIAKAQSQIQMAFVDQLKTAAGKAYALAMHEALFGDYQVLFEDLRRYEQVTKEDVRRVAQTYLVPTNRSTIRILPKTSTGGASL